MRPTLTAVVFVGCCVVRHDDVLSDRRQNAIHAGLPTCDKAEAFRILDAYVAAGGNFIDTADVYTGGDSETIIGEWLASRSKEDPELRSKLVIASKTGYTVSSHVRCIHLHAIPDVRNFQLTFLFCLCAVLQMWLDTHQVGASRKRIHDQLAQSLQRLQTDYLDVYIVHVYHQGVPIQESQSTITDLIRSGKVSNAARMGWMKPAVAVAYTAPLVLLLSALCRCATPV